MPKSESPSALHVNWAYNPDDDEVYFYNFNIYFKYFQGVQNELISYAPPTGICLKKIQSEILIIIRV